MIFPCMICGDDVATGTIVTVNGRRIRACCRRCDLRLRRAAGLSTDAIEDAIDEAQLESAILHIVRDPQGVFVAVVERYRALALSCAKRRAAGGA